MIISFSATDEEVQKIDMLRTAMRHSTRSDVLRHILADAYDKIFAKNLPIGNISCPPLPSPSEVSEALRMYKGHPWLPPGCLMSNRIMRCWDRLSADQRDCYRSMCGWSEDDVTAALDSAAKLPVASKDEDF